MKSLLIHIVHSAFQKSVLILVFGLCQFVFAQDIHFSLTELAPLQLNPAMAGVSTKVHATLNSRTQWRAVPAPFNTLYASVDLGFKSNSNWKLLAGFDAYNDRSGEPTLITNGINFYGGSKVKTGLNSSISAALSVGFKQVSIQPGNGKWGSQFNGVEYDGNLNSGEDFAIFELAGMTSAAGVVFNYSTNQGRRIVQTKKEFCFGLGAYHLNRPSNSFLNLGDDRLPVRFTAFSNGEFAFQGKKTILMPGIYYQRQGKFQEIVFGSSVKYQLRNPSQYTHLTNKLNIGWGLFYRMYDALIVKSFIDWADYSLALSYDVNSSLLTSSTGLRGGFEFAFIYSIH